MAAENQTPKWMGTVLRIAGIYNVLWGAWVVLLPAQFWALLSMDQPNYPFLWQCIGMIVGVYGLGYWVAGSDPVRHWPIVLVGLLGKIFGPIGFIDAHFVRDLVPLRFGLTLITNDLIWWVPFTLILWHAFKVETARRDGAMMDRATRGDAGSHRSAASGEVALADARVQGGAGAGRTLAELSADRPVLLVFLRHLGCTFCREALADLASARARLDAAGVRIVLVHMGDDAGLATLVAKYGVGEAGRIADPGKSLYRAAELGRGNLAQLFGVRMWLRGLEAGVFAGHGVGKLAGDGFQMPGALVLRQGRIVRAYRHQDAADRPDYCTLAST